MRIVIHVSKYYDWEPVPAGVAVTDADKVAGRVKPSVNGGWVMRVTKSGNTHTEIQMPEHQVHACALESHLRDKVVLTRAQAVAKYVARDVMPHHAHRSWMTKVETHDDGPDEALFRAAIKRMADVGKIEPEDIESLVAAYLTPADHAAHLTQHFGIKVTP